MKSSGSFADGSLDPIQISKPNIGARIASIRASRIMSLESKCKFRNWTPNAKNMATKGLKILASELPRIHTRSTAIPRLELGLGNRLPYT